MTEILLDYVEGKLSEKDVARIEAEIASDNEAQKTVAWLKQFQQWCLKVQLPAPSPAVTERIVLQHARKYSSQPSKSFWGAVTAILTFDSWVGNVAAARGSESPLTRQLAFSTSEFDVLLDVKRTTIATKLAGQVLPKTEFIDQKFVVQLVRNDVDADISVTDELGEFALTTVEQGVHQIVIIDDSGDEVWLPELTV